MKNRKIEKSEYRKFKSYIKSLNFSLRATNVILRNCSSQEEFISLNEQTLYSLQNCGRKTVHEILDFLDTLRSENDIENFQPIELPLSTKELLAMPPEESSVSLLPLFSSKVLENVAVEDLHSGFHASTQLAELVLPVRTANVLNNMGMETIGEVMLTPKSYLLEQQNFGKKSLSELEGIIRSLCLTGKVSHHDLKDEPPEVPISYTSYESMVSSFVLQCEKNLRNQELLIKRFCFQEGKVPTLEGLGQDFGITRERVRQILKKGTKNLQIKANFEKITLFWERLDRVVTHGGGIINLGALPDALQSAFDWPTPPYYRSLGEFLLLRQPDASFKEEVDLINRESECLVCDQPLEQLLALDFEETESFHVQVIAAKLFDHCLINCPWKQPVSTFHRAFIERLVDQTEGRLVLHGDVILAHGKWLGKYCENLEDVACHILEKHGRPMHFSEIANGVRMESEQYSEISDHNLHAAIRRYEKIEIVNRGTYGVKAWGLAGYRPASKAIEDFIDEKGLPQRKQDIIQHLDGDFTEGNILAALARETKFKNIGDGFYDRRQNWRQRSFQNLIEYLPESVAELENWQQRSFQNLIEYLPESVAEFVQYIVRSNSSSYRLVMAFIFIRNMDEHFCIPISKLKEMFYNFYLSRYKKGLIVEVDTAIMSSVGECELPEEEIKNKGCAEPLKSFFNSGFFIYIFHNGIQMRLNNTLAAELAKDSVRNVVLITILKVIDEYFQKITPEVVSNVRDPETHHEVAEASSPTGKESEKQGVDSAKETPTISIKKKRRSKIKL